MSALVKFLALFQSIVTFALLFGVNSLTNRNYDAYPQTLNDMGYFANYAAQAVPQTALYTAVLDHFKAPLPAGKTTKKFLFIGWDGCRADMLSLSEGDKNSAIQAFLKNGKIYQMHAGGVLPFLQVTVTAPGWTTLMTGKWANQLGGHGINRNGAKKAVNPKTFLTGLIEKNLAKSSAFIVSWPSHFEQNKSSLRKERDWADKKGYDIDWNLQEDDAAVRKATLAAIKSDRDVIMTILEYCDHTGHASGYSRNIPEYVKAFHDSDHDAFDFLTALQARPTVKEEDWLIVISTDHGGINHGHGGHTFEERQTFLASNKDLGF